MSKPSDNVQTAINRIEADSKKHQPTSSHLLNELHDLQKSETKNGKLDKDAYKRDLAQVNSSLHEAGYLPKLDIVSTGEGDAALRALSVPATSPDRSHNEFVTKVHGTSFSYDHSGHVQSWSKGDDKWSYNAQTGKFDETVAGKSTGKSSGELVAMHGDGTEILTHEDGAQTKVTAWGGAVDTNAKGEVVRTSRHNDIKTFQYDSDGKVMGMQEYASAADEATHKPQRSFERSADGKLYAATDKEHKQPVQISTRGDSTTLISQENGDSVEYRLGGTDVHRNSEEQLTEIDYHNGSKASDFKYGQLDGKSQMTQFKIIDKDGTSHAYVSTSDGVSIDGGKPVKGSLSAEKNGTLTMADAVSAKETHFLLSGAVVHSETRNGKVEPTEIDGPNGKVSKFGYDKNGDLNAVDAHGMKLHRSGRRWLDDQNKGVDFVPTVDRNGVFSIANRDGSFESWNQSGTHIVASAEAEICPKPPGEGSGANRPGDGPGPEPQPPGDGPGGNPPQPPGDSNSPAPTPPGDQGFGTKGGVMFGIDGHPEYKGSSYSKLTPEQQMEHVKRLGLGTYEMDLSSSNPETKELLDAAQRNGIKVIANFGLSSHNYKNSQDAYNAGFKEAAAMGKHGSQIEYFQLANELDGYVENRSNGKLDPAKFQVALGLMKGLDAGLKSTDPEAQTMVNSTEKGLPYLKALQNNGLDWDVTGYHWYSKDGKDLSTSGNFGDTIKDFVALGKPLYISEFNGWPSKDHSQGPSALPNNGKLLTTAMDDIVKHAHEYNIIGANVYELLDQPEYKARKPEEAEYGVLTSAGGETDASRSIAKWMSD